MHARTLIRSLFAKLDGLLAQHKEQVAAASKGIIWVEGETLVARVVGGEVRERDTFEEAADEHSVEADFKAGCRTLTADLARKYADYLARGDKDDDGLFDAHVKVAALAQVDGVPDELNREADELGKRWFGKYRVAIKELTDERRAVYDEIKGMSPEPQVIEIKRPRVRTEETADRRREQARYTDRTPHVRLAMATSPFDLLNQWEIEVLDKEMGRSGFQAWYRNPSRPSGDALAIAYQSAQGHWRRMCPDFLFFHGDQREHEGLHRRPSRPPPRRRAVPSCGALAEFAATSRRVLPSHRIGRAR